MPNVEVKVRAAAYNKGHIKTKLSEFDNDISVITNSQLETVSQELKQWVRDYLQQTTGQVSGSFDGQDISQSTGAEVRNHLYGGDIAEIL